jgi:transaldolase
MKIYVDSADREDILAAQSLGFVSGATTNPTLMRRVTKDPLRHAQELSALTGSWDFYYQPCGAYSGLLEEAQEAWSANPEHVIIKVPGTKAGAVLAKILTDQEIPVALTAAQTPNAMIAAAAIGCHAVIPYVDRACRDCRVDGEIVAALARLRRGSTQIVAASVKNVGQFTKAFSDGADAVAAPIAVLEEVLNHPAALEAEAAFAAEYRADRRAGRT